MAELGCKPWQSDLTPPDTGEGDYFKYGVPFGYLVAKLEKKGNQANNGKKPALGS